MITRKEYYCSVGCEVFRSIINIVGKGVAGVGRAWCMGCGCDIEGGGSGEKWKEEEEEEECSNLDWDQHRRFWI